MDRWRAAGALLALAACIACSAAAPTASNHTALDLYDGAPDGCYYNFQHYGEGDRIMTNEPCLNCTCHNRMLMCYLRVCPFTKPIGQDCTVEKRADQCCPIVTCPDVPVDLLTSTSTSSPAEYGSTGIGKLDKYGCSINDKYFSEGSKVPSTPNKPCEHCYCIRNMTTCVMQECTLHVDGCTPIYHKDVCCPVRYSCDHQDDEILLLDDMTTTVRPTPGFLLTTTTVSPVTQMTQDCVYNGKSYPDGGHIKTENACDHCYCMKGDIVCVVQECGSPMENEGKNCSSLPPREGQCCPDTYICDGDELSTEVSSEITTEPLLEKLTTLSPPRRNGVEGSGYRNEHDESPYTDTHILEPEVEGSGEEQASTPLQSSSEIYNPEQKPSITEEILETTEDINEYISITTKKPAIKETGTTAAYTDGVQSEVTDELITDNTSEPHEFIPYTTIVPTLEVSEQVTLEPSKEEVTSDVTTENNNLGSHQFAPSTTVLPTLEEIERATPKPKEQESVTIGSAEEETSEVHLSTTSASILDGESEMEIVGPEQGTVPVGTADVETSEHHENNLSTTISPSMEQDEILTTEQEIHEVVSEEVEKENVTIEPLQQNIVTSGTSDDESSEPHLYVQNTTGSPAIEEEEKLTTRLEETESQGQDIITGDIVETESEKPHQYVPITTSTSILKEDEQENTVLNKEQAADSESTEENRKPQQHILSTTISTFEEGDKTSTALDKVKGSTDSHHYTSSGADASEMEDSVKTTVESYEPYQHTPSTTSYTNLDDIEKETTETSKIEDFTVDSDIHEISESHQYIPSKPIPTLDDDVRDTTETHNEQDFVPTVPFLEETSTNDKYKPITSAPVSESITEINTVSEGIIIEESPEPHVYTTSTIRIPLLEDSEKATTEPDRGLNTIPSGVVEEDNSDSLIPEEATISDETTTTEATGLVAEKQTHTIETMTTVTPEFSSSSSENYMSKDDQHIITTEPTLRKEDDNKIQPVTHKMPELTTATVSLTEDVISTSTQSDSETIAQSIEQETKATSIQIPDYTHETKATTTIKDHTTELFLETSTSVGSTEKDLVFIPVIESEAVSTMPALEKIDSPETTTVNLGENEIHDDSVLAPGRIPGEGDCLLNSVTYRNDSNVPNTNKCHTDCKCISSIIKCNPIICSSPPDYMDNCQSTYDSPESCCPTYVCDNSRETIPPQPHSQMSGTETPEPSPTIECHGDECEISDNKNQPTKLAEACSTGNCLESSEKPEKHPQVTDDHKECTDGKCTHVESCNNDECQPPPIQDVVCDKEHGCQVSPVKPCEGETCQVSSEYDFSRKPELCNNDEGCKDFNVSETPIIESQEDTKQPQEGIEQECTEESCRRKGTSDVQEQLPTQCTGSDCIQKVSDLPEPSIDSQPSTQHKIEQEDIITTEPVIIMAPEEFITKKLEGSSEPPAYTNTDTSKFIPEITKTPEEYEIATKEPEIVLELTEIPKIHETSTKEQEMAAGQTSTGSSASQTSSVQPEITTESIKMETSPEKDSTSTGESVTQVSSTKSPEILVTESLEKQTQEIQELNTKQPTRDELYTESAYGYVTKAQDDTTETVDHLEINTELFDNYVTKKEPTEGPQVTKAHDIYTVEPEITVTVNYDVSSPEHDESYTKKQQETKSPDIIKDKQQEKEKSTESPKLTDIEIDQETRKPDSTITETLEITTKSLIPELSQEFVTESYIPDGISTLTQEDNKAEPTESTVPYLKPEVTPSAIESEEIGSIITKSPVDEEIYTESSLPDVIISEGQTPEIPIKEEEQKTEVTLDHVTTHGVPVPNKNEEIIKNEITTVPEMSATQEKTDSTTESEMSYSEKDKVTPVIPESHVTEIMDMISKTTENTILGQEEISTEYQPEYQVTEHDLSQPQEETSPKLPASFTTVSEQDITKTTLIPAFDESHFGTESFASEVTEPQQENEQQPTTPRAISSDHETKTILPDDSATELPTKTSEYDLDSEKDKTDLPELYVTEKMATEDSVKFDTDKEINTENPELFAPGKDNITEMTITGITESEKESPDIEDNGRLDKETELPMISKEENKTEQPEKTTEKQPLVEVDSGTEKPATSSDEKYVTIPVSDIKEISTEEPNVIVQEDFTDDQKISSEKPMSLQTESSELYIPVREETSSAMPTVDDLTATEHLEKVSEGPHHTLSEDNDGKLGSKPSVVEEETYTYQPEDVPTESLDSENKPPEHQIIEEEHVTKYPESSINYESEKEMDEVTTSVPKEYEAITNSPDVPATEEASRTEIPMSLVTESHRTSTNVPLEEIADENQKTTDNVEVHVVTKEPEVYVTEEQETVTNTPVVPVTTQEGEIGSSLIESLLTELPGTTLAESIVTEVPESSVHEQESETKVPQISITESSETYEIDHHTIEHIDKISTDLPPVTQEAHKEMSSVTGPSTESQFITPTATEPQEMDIKMEQDLNPEHVKIQTEPPLSIVTELFEASTSAPEVDVTVKLDTVTDVSDIEIQEPSKETYTGPQETVTEAPESAEDITNLADISTDKPELETTTSLELEQTPEPHAIELGENIHKNKVGSSTAASTEKEYATISSELPETPALEATTENLLDEIVETVTKEQDTPTQSTEEISTPTREAGVSGVDYITTQSSTYSKEPSTVSPEIEDIKNNIADQNKYSSTTVPTKQFEEEQFLSTVIPDTDKLSVPEEGINVQTPVSPATEKPVPADISFESIAPEEEFILATTKDTTNQFEQEASTLPPSDEKYTKPEEKPNKTLPATAVPELPKPASSDMQPIDEVPTPEEDLMQGTTKGTTNKFGEEVSTQTSPVDKYTKPEERPIEPLPASSATELPKPVSSEIQPTDEVPTPEEESHFPPSEVSGYGPEPDYVEEDQASGPGTCRYGGKVYVSAQQIPRDDPCDFCFCFRSDIICLQQSCPPPIHGCHEEPIQGFCCPRYECPVSMATTLNVTTTTTTTTTTLPPHFPTHSYKGAVQRRGCQIKGHTYKVGEVVRASSGPCLHCTCGGDGQMKCDPKACTPEPMLRQMIAAAVSAKRRR